MNIPTIGGARGIFEIFIPGTFLLLNLSVVAYLFPFIDDETKALITAGASNEVAVLVVAVSFGYLIGLLLRLFRPALPDRLSGVWLRTLNHRARQNNSEFAVLAREDFPYFDWIGEVCERFLPPRLGIFMTGLGLSRSMKGLVARFSISARS